MVLLTSPHPVAWKLLDHLVAALSSELGWDCTVVIPESDSTHESRRLDVDTPVRVHKKQGPVGDGWSVVCGSPATAVSIGLQQLCKEAELVVVVVLGHTIGEQRLHSCGGM